MDQRVEKSVSGRAMREILFEKFKHDERCKGVGRFGIYRLAEPGQPNWTVAFVGGHPGWEANRAVDAIAAQVAAEYDVAW
jgi:hypothetical protein